MISNWNLKITKNNILLLCVMAILLFPSAVFYMGEIYSSVSPYYINYDWLDYRFGFIQLFITVSGLIAAILLRKGLLFLLFLLYCIIREELFLFTDGFSALTENRFEIYLALITGWLLVYLVDYLASDFKKREIFFWITILFNILTIFICYLGEFNKNVGRYNASNLDVGATGVISVLFLLFIVFNNKVKLKKILVLVGLVALWLSGSRTSFFMLGIVVILTRIIFYKIFLHKDIKYLYKYSIILFIFSALLYFGGYIDLIVNHFSNSRMLALMISGEFFNDMSISGRIHSIKVGLEILSDNVLGISASFINLQLMMAKNGYPTFPHSTLLSYYILFGPLVFIAIAYLFKLLRSLYIRREYQYFSLILYLILNNIVYGSPILNFKMIFFYFMIVELADLKVKDYMESVKA